MKILMVPPLFYPHIGGVEKHVKRISEELVMQGHKVSIMTVKHDSTLKDSEMLGKIEIHRFPKGARSQIWDWIFKHRDLIENADIIHCHDFNSFILWYFPFRFLFPFKPVFITFHGYEGIIPVPNKILFLRKITEYLTNGNICIGDYIPKWYGTKANYISYGAADLLPAEDDTNFEKAIFVGRLEKDTGIMTYINAIKILKKKYNINLEVEICGDGSLHKEIEELIKTNELNVKIFGFVENPTDYLIKCKFAFVSGYLAIIEAMAGKKLVFSVYDNELKRDYLYSIPNSKNTMVLASSPETLASKIAYFLKNPEKEKEIITNAYNFAREQTWQQLTAIYLKLWGLKLD
jgi:glycosyltransferase involved in cell wall biosynthesis